MSLVADLVSPVPSVTISMLVAVRSDHGEKWALERNSVDEDAVSWIAYYCYQRLGGWNGSDHTTGKSVSVSVRVVRAGGRGEGKQREGGRR